MNSNAVVFFIRSFTCLIRDTGKGEEKKGPSATNLIIGSIAGAILVAAIVLGGTGWGFNLLALYIF
eukprot:bmy_01675T0